MHAKLRAQTLNNNMGAVMPQLQQLLSKSPEGEKHLQEVNLVWGEINTHTIGEEQALSKVHAVIKQALEGITAAMQTQENTITQGNYCIENTHINCRKSKNFSPPSGGTNGTNNLTYMHARGVLKDFQNILATQTEKTSCSG